MRWDRSHTETSVPSSSRCSGGHVATLVETLQAWPKLRAQHNSELFYSTSHGKCRVALFTTFFNASFACAILTRRRGWVLALSCTWLRSEFFVESRVLNETFVFAISMRWHILIWWLTKSRTLSLPKRLSLVVGRKWAAHPTILISSFTLFSILHFIALAGHRSGIHLGNLGRNEILLILHSNSCLLP